MPEKGKKYAAIASGMRYAAGDTACKGRLFGCETDMVFCQNRKNCPKALFFINFRLTKR